MEAGEGDGLFSGLFTPSSSPHLNFTLPDASLASHPHFEDAGSQFKEEPHSLSHFGDSSGLISADSVNNMPTLSLSGNDTAFLPYAGHMTGREASGEAREVTEAEVRALFEVPLAEAASKLGMSPSSFKKLCRKVGIAAWPARRLAWMERRLVLLRPDLTALTPHPEAVREAARLERHRQQLLAGSLHDEGLPGSPLEPLLDGEGGEHEVAEEAGTTRPDGKEGGARGEVAGDGGWRGAQTAARQAQPQQREAVGEERASSGEGRAAAPLAAQMDKIEEENDSLRAISKYLLKERQELMRKSEVLAKQTRNLRNLARVLRLQLDGHLEPDEPDDAQDSAPPHSHSLLLSSPAHHAVARAELGCGARGGGAAAAAAEAEGGLELLAGEAHAAAHAGGEQGADAPWPEAADVSHAMAWFTSPAAGPGPDDPGV